MSRSLLLALMSAALIAGLVGCKATPQTPVAPLTSPISSEQFEQMRTTFAQTDPNVRLGLVSDVLPDADYLSITGLSAADFAPGTVVSIIDSSNNVLAHGEVANVVDGRIDVRFTTSGARRPAVGDAAVKF